MAASAVAVAGVTGTQNVAAFVAMITLVSGLLFLLLAVLKMGWIAQFLSRAVVTGFLFGAAIDVVIGELPKLTGTKATGSIRSGSWGPGSRRWAKRTGSLCWSVRSRWWSCSGSG